MLAGSQTDSLCSLLSQEVRATGEARRHLISDDPLTDVAMKIIYHSEAYSAIANWIFHFITCKGAHMLPSRPPAQPAWLHGGNCVNSKSCNTIIRLAAYKRD